MLLSCRPAASLSRDHVAHRVEGLSADLFEGVAVYSPRMDAAARWVDSHCHLHLSKDDPEVLLGRADAAGVDWVVCPGTDAAGSEAAAALAARFPHRVLATAGLHPHDAVRWGSERKRIIELAAAAAAVGECGLDYYRDLSPRPLQQAAFAEQLSLAVELDKPVVVHCRDAFADVHAALEAAAAGPRAVMHCWTGGPRWTKRFRDLGVTFSFAGPITYSGGETVRLAAAEAPPERTMVETDTPYLSPPPHRGEPNEPSRVPLVGAALAAVWQVDTATAATATSATARRVFGG